MHFCLEGEGEGEDCFAVVQRLALEACSSYERCARTKSVTYEQKVDIYHLLMTKGFRMARREGTGDLQLEHSTRGRYLIYVRFLLRIMQYLIEKDLVYVLDIFFVHKLLNEFANPTNWMSGRSIAYDNGEFDMFGNRVYTSQYCIPFVETQCKYLGRLLSKLYDFLLMHVLKDDVPTCETCAIIRGFRLSPACPPECSVMKQLQFDMSA